MTEGVRVEVSRRVGAAAATVFALLADPRAHCELDGSGMLRGAEDGTGINAVGDVFDIRMHRLGRDYLMVNHVVEFVPDRRIAWAPAPGDLETAGGDPARIGVPAGYRWGYVLTPDRDDATVVTEFFDCGPEDNRWILEREDGRWINGHTTVLESMTATLGRLAALLGG